MPTEEVPPEVAEARRKLREKMGAQGAQVGGKGSMRRKSKPIPKSAHNDERKVAEISRKAGLQEIGGMDEANIIFNDGSVVQLAQPKVRGLLQANTFVIHGTPTPSAISKLSPDMRGDYVQAPSGGPMGGLPPVFQSAAMKFKMALEKAGVSDADLAKPEMQQKLMGLMDSAGFTSEERAAMDMMMTAQGGGASGAGAGEAADDVPELSGNTNFEDVAEAD